MEMTIWMDDRPRPSAHALHTQAGFTTGRWEGGALGARTTHLKAGFIRKTGVPLSDQATIDWRFFRHGDLLTVLMVARDPVYLVEPEIISKSFRLSKNAARCPRPVRSWLRGARTRRRRAALRAGPEPVPRRVHEAVQPAARGGARLSRHAVSGVPQEDQGHLRPTAAVHRRLRRRRQLRPAPCHRNDFGRHWKRQNGRSCHPAADSAAWPLVRGATAPGGGRQRVRSKAPDAHRLAGPSSPRTRRVPGSGRRRSRKLSDRSRGCSCSAGRARPRGPGTARRRAPTRDRSATDPRSVPHPTSTRR